MTRNLSTPSRPVITPPRRGLMHAVDATRYSLAGFSRLLSETAARLELIAAACVALAYLWLGVSLWNWLITGFLLALVLAIEALNTAIEVLCDRISPEWSRMAKDAKDLGSLAVGLMLLVTGIFVALVLMRMI